MSWKNYVDAVAKLDIKYPHLAAAMLAQAILESGRETTDLAKLHNNHHGIKWRKEMESICNGVDYKTSSEPTGSAIFCKFATKEDEVHGYWHFLTRSPYAGWENHINNAEDFLSFICPVWCPYGYTKEWIAKHGGLNYHEYIMKNLYQEACNLLEEARKNLPKPDPQPIPTINKRIGLNVGHHGTAGASGIDKSIKETEANQCVVDVCKSILINNGFKTVDEVNQDTHGGLSGVGKAAANYDLFIAVHFNAFKKEEKGPGWLGGANKPESMKFGKYWAAQVAKVFGYPNVLGRLSMAVTVTTEMDKTKCPVAILLECEFIDEETDRVSFMKDAAKHGVILADCIIKYFRGEI